MAESDGLKNRKHDGGRTSAIKGFIVKVLRRYRKLIIAFQVLVLMGLLAIMVPLNGKPVGYLTYEVFTNRPAFCMNCHIMETRLASWRRSTHFRVTVCMDCHSEPGFIGEWKAHFDGMRYIWAMITKTRTGSVIQAHVKNSSCLECHEEYRDMKDAVYHNLHEKGGVHCTACHDNLMVHRTSLIPPEHIKGAHNCVNCHDVDDPMYKEIIDHYYEPLTPKIPEVNDYIPPR